MTIKNKLFKTKCSLIASSILIIGLSGCMSTDPKMGGSSGNTISGGAAGGTASNENSAIEKCDRPLGTVALYEDQSLSWWNTYRHRYPKLGSTEPVIRTMIQQSNCFVIVERGRAMQAMNRERQLMQDGQLRGSSNFGGGQMVAADYTVSPSVQFAEKDTGGLKGIAGGIFGGIGAAIGGGLSKNEAATNLTLIDNRSGVQVATAVGNAGNYDFDLFGGMFSFISGGAKGYANTPEGKVLMAAFADSYNQMVIALRNYKPQKVRGGLGTGGELKVDGQVKSTTSARITNVEPVATQAVVINSGNRNVRINVDEYDEHALENYYNHLKIYTPMLTSLMTTGNNKPDHKANLESYSIMLLNLMDSSRIELEAWPLEARQQGWNVLGKRIEQYHKMFERDRKRILLADNVSDGVKDTLRSVQLLNKNTLLSL